MNNAILVTALYYLASLPALWPFYYISKKISGDKLNAFKLWCLFGALMPWGMIHLNIAYHGYILWLPASSDVLYENDLVRLSAFIVTILLTCSLPSKEEPRRRSLWKQRPGE